VVHDLETEFELKEDGKKKYTPLLGIYQKSLKKGAIDKMTKVGRKKDLEKMNIMRDSLVEYGVVKKLESHIASSHE
jgi:hypothetical protein